MYTYSNARKLHIWGSGIRRSPEYCPWLRPLSAGSCAWCFSRRQVGCPVSCWTQRNVHSQRWSLKEQPLYFGNNRMATLQINIYHTQNALIAKWSIYKKTFLTKSGLVLGIDFQVICQLLFGQRIVHHEGHVIALLITWFLQWLQGRARSRRAWVRTILQWRDERIGTQVLAKR